MRPLVGVQLKVRVRMRAKDGQMTSALWSAATCRRYAPGVKRKAATSRRTPKELVIVQLRLTKAEPEATRTSNYTTKTPVSKTLRDPSRLCVFVVKRVCVKALMLLGRRTSFRRSRGCKRSVPRSARAFRGRSDT